MNDVFEVLPWFDLIVYGPPVAAPYWTIDCFFDYWEVVEE